METTGPFEIREAIGASEHEVETIAVRMRETLIEVLGKERGESMYSTEWLIDRVRFHLEQRSGPAKVFVVTDSHGVIVGHTIVRQETEVSGPIGLFSTTYVCPDVRGQGLAKRLLAKGEDWIHEQGLEEAVTYTAPWNSGLRQLYEKRGYRCDPVNDEFVRLSKRISD